MNFELVLFWPLCTYIQPFFFGPYGIFDLLAFDHGIFLTLLLLVFFNKPFCSWKHLTYSHSTVSSPKNQFVEDKFKVVLVSFFFVKTWKENFFFGKIWVNISFSNEWEIGVLVRVWHTSRVISSNKQINIFRDRLSDTTPFHILLMSPRNNR